MIAKIKLNVGIMPKKATKEAAAYDLYTPEDVVLKNGRQIIDMKFSLKLPHGYAATIQPRSGFSAKGFEATKVFIDGSFSADAESGVRVNGDVIRGLIDEDYRGSVGVIVHNHDTEFLIKAGTRIAQMTFHKVETVEWEETDTLSETDRDGGFGSTGTK